MSSLLVIGGRAAGKRIAVEDDGPVPIRYTLHNGVQSEEELYVLTCFVEHHGEEHNKIRVLIPHEHKDRPLSFLLEEYEKGVAKHEQ